VRSLRIGAIAGFGGGWGVDALYIEGALVGSFLLVITHSCKAGAVNVKQARVEFAPASLRYFSFSQMCLLARFNKFSFFVTFPVVPTMSASILLSVPYTEPMASLLSPLESLLLHERAFGRVWAFLTPADKVATICAELNFSLEFGCWEKRPEYQ
jgi:hypothetical protein